MLLHASNNILVKKLFGNNLVGRFSYISLTITLGAGVNFWEFWRSPKARNNWLISCGREKMMKTRGGVCNTYRKNFLERSFLRLARVFFDVYSSPTSVSQLKTSVSYCTRVVWLTVGPRNRWLEAAPLHNRYGCASPFITSPEPLTGSSVAT